jgi:hypothetical protein
MPREPIPDELRRFILTSVPSVPFVEAMLLFMARPGEPIELLEIAKGLYVADTAASDVVEALRAAHIVEAVPPSITAHRYAPATEELARVLSHLAAMYAHDLIGVTDLIHSRTGRKAQQFADAFKLRKDS